MYVIIMYVIITNVKYYITYRLQILISKRHRQSGESVYTFKMTSFKQTQYARIPEENIINSDFIEAGRLKSGSDFITRVAPGIGKNIGGGIEVVVPEKSVSMQWFNSL